MSDASTKSALAAEVTQKAALDALGTKYREDVLKITLTHQANLYELERQNTEARLKMFHQCIRDLSQGWVGYDSQGQSKRYAPEGDNVLRAAALVVTGSVPNA